MGKVLLMDTMVKVRTLVDGMLVDSTLPEQYLLDGKRYFNMAVCYKMPINEPTDPKGTTYIRVTIPEGTEVSVGRAAVLQFIEENLGADPIEFCKAQGYDELLNMEEDSATTH